MTTAGAGIDVSRHTLNIHINGRDDSATNDTDGFRKVAGILRRGKAERAVMEATGRMHRALLQSLHDRGFAVAVVNPRQCRDLPRPGAPGRTGRAGAGVPAAFGAAFPDMAPAAPADVTAGRLRDMPGLRGAPVDRRAEPRRFPPGSESRIPTGPSRGCSYEPPPVKRFLHDVSHRSVSSLGRLGASRGFSRRNIAFQGAPNTRRRVQAPVRFGWPADAGPVTRVPRSGGATFREGGTHLDGRCRGMRRTMPRAGHTPYPGSPRAPSGRPGVRCPVFASPYAGAFDRTAPSGTSPVVANRTGATSSFPGSATIPRLPGRPSRALTYCTDHPDSALSGWWWSQRQAIRARCFRSIGLPALLMPRSWSTAPPGQGTGPGPAGLAGPRRLRRSRQDSSAPSSSASFGPIPLSRPGTAAWRACAGTTAGAAPGGVSASRADPASPPCPPSAAP